MEVEAVKALAFALIVTACAGEPLEKCAPAVVLANPGPAAGCMRVHAGEGTLVRLVGDEGPGESSVDVHAGDDYEALSCSPAEETGPPRVVACDAVDQRP